MDIIFKSPNQTRVNLNHLTQSFFVFVFYDSFYFFLFFKHFFPIYIY